MSQAASSKPPKLRTACNQCNATKTKCSGEKTGCKRCKHLRTECIYAESRIGRVPGIRAKARATARTSTDIRDRVSSSRETPTTTNDTIDLDLPLTQSPRSRNEPAQMVTPASFDDVGMNWSINLNETQQQGIGNHVYGFDDTSDLFETLVQQPLSPTTSREQQLPRNLAGQSPSLPQPSNDFRLSGMYFDPNESQALARGRGSQSQGSFSGPSQSQLDAERRSNSQIVIACSQMILSLEKYLYDELKVLDIILGIVKRAVDRLHPLVDLHLAHRDPKSFSLFGIILYQIVQLFEAGCSSFLVGGHAESHDQILPDPLSGGLHDLAFGSFAMNPDEERQRRSRLVLRELRSVEDLLRKIEGPISVESNAYKGFGSGTERGDCYRDLESRLGILKERARRQGGL